MLEKQRQELLVTLLNEKGYADVHMLCAALNASEATIRRDINKLAKGKLLVKIRGGAQAIENSKKTIADRAHIDSSLFLVDKEKNYEKKRLIAKKAVEICKNGESIIINGGSSTFMMSEYLPTKNLKILTNSIVLAQELWENPSTQISLPGGEIYPSQGLILSDFDDDIIPNYHCSKMFMGTPAINNLGVMESDTLLVRAEKKLRKQAEKLVILADSSKIGASSNFIFAPLTDVDILITDSGADKKTLDELRSKGIEVIVVNG